MLSTADYDGFCERVEAQTVRQLRRYLDYGRRVRQEAGVAELEQWTGRILLDREDIYGLDDWALAFGIASCEWLAWHWAEMAAEEAQVITIAGPVDKVLLVRLLVAAPDPGHRAALAALFAQRYGRVWNWIRERAEHLSELESEGDRGPSAGILFERFLQHLESLAPLPAADGEGQAERELAEVREREARLEREVAAVTDRAERAVTRMEALQEEVATLRRSVRDERENGERLREERSRRIKAERDARDAAAELERLKAEYLKLDGRLREAAQGRGGPATVGPMEVSELSRLDPRQLLGIEAGATAEDLAQARRRFAAAFHSDRAAQLPSWVGELFDRLLGIVNDACDRTRR